ncbi:fimbrial protein [Pseudomonas canadensis]|uniref:fimbrial protein n=1 Tax=Pseudomonas canadensis TaxID=915099 RepID=UPI0028128B55|nr:fimbrial protein [Pseudomonas canadensis]
MTLSIKTNILSHAGMFIIFLIYSSFSDAACQENNVYIKPTISELQFASSAAGKGGMLSSAWHEATIQLSCTDMPTGVGAQYVYNYFMKPTYAGSSTSFEGQNYALWSTSDPDIFIIASIAKPDGSFSSITSSEFDKTIKISKPDANKNIQEPIRVRIRYLSTKSSLKPGLKVINEIPLLVGVVSGSGVACTARPGGLTDCYSRVSPVVISPASFNVNRVSCTLDAPALVKLRPLNISSLPSAGATVEVASFQLGASCNKSPVAYNVYYSMTDVNTPSNTSNNLTLAALPDQASGVALQVLDDGKAVSFGFKGSLNSIGMMATTGGIKRKMLNVVYIRGNEMVKPGKVNAGVTVTLAYE